MAAKCSSCTPFRIRLRASESSPPSSSPSTSLRFFFCVELGFIFIFSTKGYQLCVSAPRAINDVSWLFSTAGSLPVGVSRRRESFLWMGRALVGAALTEHVVTRWMGSSGVEIEGGGEGGAAGVFAMVLCLGLWRESAVVVEQCVCVCV